jgi:hypothetical protein
VEYEFNTEGTWMFNGSLMWRAAKVICWLGIIDITVMETFHVMVIFALSVWLQDC